MIVRIGLFMGALLSLTCPVAANETNPASLNGVRLYVPIRQIPEWIGNDPRGLVEYIKALEKRAGEILAEEEPVEAKGLLIAVGIKSKNTTRIWCEAVGGEAPEELLRRLEKDLGKIKAIDLKSGPAGFAMEVNLYGQKPDRYPEFPQSWMDAARSARIQRMLPPDALFESIWPD